MIEETVRNYLDNALDVPVWMEMPKTLEDTTPPDSYVLIQKTGSSRSNRLNHATFALQSYAGTMYGAAELNEVVKAAMDGIVTLDKISASKLNSDYNFTDTRTKQYRYQAVYEVTHY